MIAQAVKVLKEGGIVAHPTDTCYGLAVDVFNETALNRLFSVKGMDSTKPVSVLVSSLAEARTYGVFSKMALRIGHEFWPGPLTLVVPRTEKVPAFLNPGASDIGLRVVHTPLVVALFKAFGGPVTTTSANRHGALTPYSVEEISMEPDLILDVGALPSDEKPSTVIRIEGKQAVTLRQGNLFFRL